MRVPVPLGGRGLLATEWVMQGEDACREVKVQTAAVSDRSPVVIVDVANVAYGRQARADRPRLDFVRRALAEVAQAGVAAIAVADAALRHKIDEQEEYERLVDRGDIQQAPAGTEADVFIWKLAIRLADRGREVSILTNDMFPVELSRVEREPRIQRVSFMFVADELILQPSLVQGAVTRGGNRDLVGHDGEPRANRPLAGQSPDPNATTVPARAVRQPAESQRPRPPPSAESQPRGIPPGVLASLRQYFEVRGRNPEVPRRVNFASVAHYLQSTYGRGFESELGFDKPKEIAETLERDGYVTISHNTTTLYIEPTPKLLESGGASRTSRGESTFI